jgi:4-aminobutyrate aminotransferase-like enzyme
MFALRTERGLILLSCGAERNVIRILEPGGEASVSLVM